MRRADFMDFASVTLCGALSGPTHLAQSLYRTVFVTDFGIVEVSRSTAYAMDTQFPGWRGEPMRGRSKAVRLYNERAQRGAELLDNAVTAIAALAFAAGQSLEEV